MIKKDLVLMISRETGLTQSIVKEVVQRFLDSVIESLVDEEKVELRNFGVFILKTRNPRIGRNPHNPGKPIPIPAKKIPSFKPSKEMLAAVTKPVTRKS